MVQCRSWTIFFFSVFSLLSLIYLSDSWYASLLFLKVVRTWGEINPALKIDGTPGKMHHHEIMTRLGMVEFKKGVELAGHR